jgi:CheY-like chemotaxis protein
MELKTPEPPRPTTIAPEVGEHPARRFSILVTDDDKGSRETLAGLLQDRGFATLQATSGEEAIEIVRVETIHLVLFDMHMPRMTGLEALQQVRFFNALLPAILVTADANREVIRQALYAQVYSVLPKPVNKTLLFHTLARALNLVYGIPPEAEPNPGLPPNPVPPPAGQ